MTGYGKAIAETPQKKITIEIKSLNSKQLDLSTKMPWLYKEKEPEIRNMISQRLDRGKIDFSIYCDMLDNEIVTVINKAAVRNYYNQFKEIASDLKIDLDDQIFTAIMKLPDTLKTEKARDAGRRMGNCKKSDFRIYHNAGSYIELKREIL